MVVLFKQASENVKRFWAKRDQTTNLVPIEERVREIDVNACSVANVAALLTHNNVGVIVGYEAPRRSLQTNVYAKL